MSLGDLVTQSFSLEKEQRPALSYWGLEVLSETTAFHLRPTHTSLPPSIAPPPPPRSGVADQGLQCQGIWAFLSLGLALSAKYTSRRSPGSKRPQTSLTLSPLAAVEGAEDWQSGGRGAQGQTGAGRGGGGGGVGGGGPSPSHPVMGMGTWAQRSGVTCGRRPAVSSPPPPHSCPEEEPRSRRAALRLSQALSHFLQEDLKDGLSSPFKEKVRECQAGRPPSPQGGSLSQAPGVEV